MRITTPYGTLMVDEQTRIPLTITNPMFSNEGSHSLPFTVPWCEHNLAALGHPERVHSGNYSYLKMDATLESKRFIARGSLEIIGISDGSNIELCLKTREGGFWDWAKNTQLRDISIPHKALDLTIIGFQAIKNTYFNGVWPDVDFSFAPIATEFQSLDYYQQEENYNHWAGRKLCISDYMLWNNPGDLYRNDSDRTSRLSPFVYLNAAIQWVCSSYGYRINENYLASTAELRSAILLNRAYSPEIIGGFNIPPKYLLPNVNVMDFIDSTEKAFGCNFYVDHKTRSINILSVSSRFSKSPKKIDGTVFISEKTEGSSIEFKAQRISSPYSTVTERAINNFFFTYESQSAPIIHNKIYQTDSSPNYETYPNKIVFSQALQAYFFFEWVEGTDVWEYTSRCIHSKLHDVKINENFTSLDVDFKGYFAPMIPITCRQFYKDGTANSYFDYTLIVPFIDKWDWIFSFKDGFLGDNEEDAPIVFAFSRGRIVNINFPVTLFELTQFNLPWASTDVFDKNGTKIVGADLALRFEGLYGIYENFYKELELFYNNNKNKLELVNVNKEDLLSSNIEDTLLVDGVRLMVSSLELNIKSENNFIDTASVFALKPFV